MASILDRPVRPGVAGRLFQGQPAWFGTLFWMDMWERFSFYGMTAILYLYASAPVSDGGFGLPAASAAALFGTYMSLVFLAALPGGWLADRVLGTRRAVVLGGAGIAAGHAVLSLPVRWSLYLGLLFVIAGTGLLKPAMAALVSSPHRDDRRREAAMSIFYMSIQLSALLAPVVVGLLAEKVAWHLGFGAAAIGMTAGLIVYAAGARRFGDLGLRPAAPLPPDRRRVLGRRAGTALGALALALLVGTSTGVVHIEHVLMASGLLLLALPAGYVLALRRIPALTGADRGRLGAYVVLLAGSSVFWLLYAQGGSVLAMFAQRHTDRDVAGWTVPVSWFQSAHPFFILVLAPVFAALWLRLGRRVDVPVKFAAALVCAGVSWLLLAVAARLAAGGDPVSPLWLLSAFLLQVCGELALAPVGLSLAVKVAPAGYTNQYLGLFWLFAAVGAGLGGQLARLAEVLSLPAYFLLFGALATVVGVVLAGAVRWLRGHVGDAPAATTV
ncbi:peptide MFS transporter [Couchioplanes azureus]|uniref:peptide MFS transporter n=1 Tax=Couchioplanes caeruleus TaxID=56438 RepID=UPI001670635C|nr:peptide MFS transporter [Couchioplanes caeruleus]GGQ81191.1 peptide transporter [Couchioplanes caeruleus subsp. azureus]